MAADPRGSPTTMFHYSLVRGPQHGKRDGAASTRAMCSKIFLGEIQLQALCSSRRGEGGMAKRLMQGRFGRGEKVGEREVDIVGTTTGDESIKSDNGTKF